MPFLSLPSSLAPRRVHIQGPPNTGKTHSFLGWTRPAFYVGLPGEKGSATLPSGLPDLTAFRWESNPAEKTSSQAVLTAVEGLVFPILAGKQGVCVSLMLDGIHKYYGHVLNHVTGGAHFRGEQFEAKEYARAHERFNFFLDQVLSSPIEYVVMGWAGSGQA